MAAISKPVGFLAVFAVALGIYAYSDPGTAKTGRAEKPKKKVARKADAGWDFPPVDHSVHFDKPKAITRDPFLPVVKNLRMLAPPLMEKDDVVQIPGRLAGGEGGWAYTGMVEVDGARMALLENSSTKKVGYVREGEDWKKAHVVGITTACIVLSDEKGVAETIYRFNPNDPPKVKPLPEGGFQPLNPGGIPGRMPPGRIGSGFQIRPLASSPSGAAENSSSAAPAGATMIIR